MAAALLSNFPSTSDAFSNFVSPTHAGDDVTHSPPRKAAKLDARSSASSSKGKEKAVDGGRYTRMRINLVNDGADLRAQVEAQMPRLARSIRAILTPYRGPDSKPETIESFETVNMSCRVLVLIGHRGQDVYDAVRLELEKSLRDAVAFLVGANKGVSWLHDFVTTMEWYDRRVDLLRSLLVDLDRGLCLRNSSLLPIRELCLDIIQNTVYRNPRCVSRISEGISQWAQDERKPKVPDASGDVDMEVQEVGVDAVGGHPTIRRLIAVLNIVGMFESHFRDPYIAEATSFFTEESENLATNLTPTRYFMHCESRLDQEDKRALELVDYPTRMSIMQAVESALMPLKVMRDLCKEGVSAARKERDLKALSRMFTLYKRVKALPDLMVSFGEVLREVIEDIVKDPANGSQMVTRLLEEKAFLDKALLEAFHERPFTNTLAVVADDAAANGDRDEDRPFSYAARTAIEKGLLTRKRKPAEMIAKCIDAAMRKGHGEEPEEVFWQELDNVLGLYRFTQDKDVFRTFYERALAKRLLLSKSASDALEQRVINRLRDGYDPEFGRGNDMFKDIALSKDLMEEYRLSKGDKDERMTAMVLKFSTWPYSKSDGTINLPVEMDKALASFSAFYKSKHKNHKLEWLHNLGTVILLTNFTSGEKELSVSLYQAVVLLLFKDEDKLGYKDILTRSGLKPSDLEATLQSLANGKVRVLMKKPRGKEINDTDEFLFVSAFEDKRRKIHISSIQQQETVEETKQIEHAIDQDRQASIDAAIVRIMKGSKKLTDEELKIKTIQALQKHFVPTVPDIKKRIEYLLERDYMERDEKQNNLYHYVA